MQLDYYLKDKIQNRKEGISIAPNGKYIVRVRSKNKGKGDYLQTISQHLTKEEAELSYNNFNKKFFNK